jgi:hypothetical protein
VRASSAACAVEHRNERRWLELIARAEEGTKKLGREGMRCGEGRGGGGLIALL